MKNVLQHEDRAVKFMRGDQKPSKPQVENSSFAYKVYLILYNSSFILHMTV
ncbi:hypothetical protein [Scytonema sp. NUACC21]